MERPGDVWRRDGDVCAPLLRVHPEPPTGVNSEPISAGENFYPWLQYLLSNHSAGD